MAKAKKVETFDTELRDRYTVDKSVRTPSGAYSVSNRDEFTYQSDYTFPWRIAALFSFQYENERGRLISPALPTGRIIKRTNYLYALQIQGDIKHRLFYSLGGSVENNELYGIAGTVLLAWTGRKTTA